MVFSDKYTKLLETNPKFKDWHEHVYYEKSPKSADNMKRNIGLFCEKMDLQPDALLDLSESGKLNDIFESFRDSMKKEHRGSYISKFKHAINNFLKYNKMKNRIDAEISNENKSSKYNGESIPTKNILQRILEKATLRGRVSISLMAFSGLRPESIGSYLGNNGIRLKDISGLDYSDPHNLKFTEFPIKIKVRDTEVALTRISKNGHAYWTLAGHQTEGYIIDYLTERVKNGETLTPETPLVTFERHGYGVTNVKLKQPSTEHVRRDIRNSMRKAGFGQRPYTLRRYFMQTLSTAELKGYISMEWRLFLSGHSGNIQSTYVSDKENMNPELEKTVKDSFVKCLKLLETEHYDTEDDKTLLYSALLTTAHFTEEEINGLNLNSMSDSDIIEMIRKRVSDRVKGNSDKYLSVPVAELNTWASKGYQFKGFVPNTDPALALMELVI